jgi:hypothetical protein
MGKFHIFAAVCGTALPTDNGQLQNVSPVSCITGCLYSSVKRIEFCSAVV